jgi:hypothetical protein
MLRALALSVVLLAACGPAPPPAAPDACGASPRADLVGRPVQLALDLPPGARIIRPGDAVTEDFSDTRLNVFLDAQDVITALTCG